MFGFNYFKNLEARIQALEGRSGFGYNLPGLLESEFKRRDKKELRRTTEFSLHKAWVVDTLDPWKQGRVRYFSPYFNEPGIPIDACSWAAPISTFGGFDDSGSWYVPPAGSLLAIIFEAGDANSAFYLGTIWNRNRGPEGNPNWNTMLDGIPEYDKLHQGHRKGYFLGPSSNPNDESQVLPPWNTESYNGGDWDGINPVKPEDYMKATYPNIGGIKSTQKHMWKWVDGDPQCNYRWKRMELLSSLGNWMIFKDDHLHEGGQWCNPLCSVPCSGESNLDCVDSSGNPIEQPNSTETFQGEGINVNFKHQNECRPYKGVGTPQNNRCALPQSGIQILSISGITMIMDDSVEEARGIPEWERSLQPFDFGETDTYLGKFTLKSAFGQIIELNDEEKAPGIRGREAEILKPCDAQDNWLGPRGGILLLTGTGNRIEINDDTLEKKDTSGPEEKYIAGPKRGFTIQSSALHSIELIDDGNRQSLPIRRNGAQPDSKASHAYVRIRSGYGLEMMMADDNSQEECQAQYIQILSPQKEACAGPHIFRMQEKPECGYIFVRAAGDYVRISAGHEVVMVGEQKTDCLGPKNRIVIVTDNYINATTNLYYNYAHDHVFFAEQYIILAAGRDCPDANGTPHQAPCIYPVATMKCAQFCPLTGLVCLDTKSFSTRVFVSNDDTPCSST